MSFASIRKKTNPNTENTENTDTPKPPLGAMRKISRFFSRPFRPLKRFMPRSLFGRTFLIIIIPVVIVQIFATFIFYDRHWTKISNKLAETVTNEISYIVQLIEAEPDPDKRNLLLTTTNASIDLVVSLSPHKPIGQNQGPKIGIIPPAFDTYFRKHVRRSYSMNTLLIEEKKIIVDIQLQDGSELSVTIPERRIYSPSAYIFIIWLVGFSLVIFAVAIIFMRNQIRPILRLAVAADALGKGRDVTGFKVEGAREVRMAARAFLLMKQRLQRQINQRTAMLSGVSHDLRTPLTRMKLQLAMMPKSEDIEDLSHDLQDMETMIEGYLAFARGEGQETSSDIYFPDFIEEIISLSARSGTHILGKGKPPALYLKVRPTSLKRALTNLISNATKYAETVYLTCLKEEDALLIFIDDNGPGIPENLREEMFKPFARGDTARNLDIVGTGLGLTIARDIIRSHGGDLTLSSAPQGGLRAEISLPY